MNQETPLHLPPHIVIVGPTASGKSSLALRLAEELQAEIVNCDSVQLYRGFDIGSAKASPAEQVRVPHHLLDCLEWTDPGDARWYADTARAKVIDIAARGRLPLIVGGTGLYLRALWQQQFDDLPKDESLRAILQQRTTADLWQELQQIDPSRAAQLHPNDRFRIQRSLEVNLLTKQNFPQRSEEEVEQTRSPSMAFKIYMRWPRQELHERIAERSKQMLDFGLIEEVEALALQGVDLDCRPMQSIGYRQVVEFLRGERLRESLEEAITIATRQYAKRQETWFRRLSFDYHCPPEWQLQTLLADIHAFLKN